MSTPIRVERPVTIKDVAKRVGVSPATVSYVLNETTGKQIPEETCERVRRAVRELGYRPNIGARQMRTRRTNLIGIVTDGVATTPFAGAMLKGAQDAARTAGKLLLAMNTDGDPENERKAVETLLEHRVEGTMYATMFHRPVKPPPGLMEGRAVLLDCYVDDRSIASVTPDEVTAGRVATELILERGHRRVGMVNSIDDVPAASGRQRGYQTALQAAGIASDATLVRFAASSATSGYEETLALMRRSDRPTALFCFNDGIAMGAYDALREHGLRIPDDVAVVGFDNHEIIAAGLRPGLTTMQLPHYEMGVWAVQYLLDDGNFDTGGRSVQMKLPCLPVMRGSV